MKSSAYTLVKCPFTILKNLTLIAFLLISINANAQVVLNITDEIGAQDVTVDFTVENWSDIVACQLSVSWDPEKISLDSIGNYSLNSLGPGSFNVNNSPSGFFTMAWVEPTAQGTTLPDGSAIFSMYFEVLQEGYAAITIEDSPTPIEVVKADATVATYTLDHGSITGAGNLLQGNVYHDANDDCAFQTGEETLQNWIIKLSGTNTFYTSSDQNGDYSLFVDPDLYNLEIIYPNELWSACDNQIDVDLSGDIDPITFDLPINSIVDCPLMQVDVSTPFLRRCFSNNYYVDYCNVGTISSVDPYIEIELDQYLTLTTSSIPYTVNPNGLYVFEVDDLDIGACGSFNFETILDCDSTIIGQTHCVTAHAYPDSICTAPNNSWSGASLKIIGECVNDNEVQFTIENTGENMIMESHYIVIEDAVMFAPSNFSLNAGATMPLSFPANGSTYRLEVGQVADHPGLSMPSVSVEGCGTNTNEEFSLGYVTLFPEDDNDTWISIDCQENIGSYDPNDKAASPAGYGDQHYIKPNTDIEYKIRFQNTGTDTAFTVVVEDTLSAFLNPETIRLGASSHPYSFELNNQGLLRFTFDNIMLPDSNINEVASHGFVKFRIAQQADLSDGTLINNEAAIYFDFNDAVWTNTTFHEVQREFIQVSTDEIFVEGVDVKVYPNPFSGTTNFEVNGKEYKALTLKVFDSTGRVISYDRFEEQRFEFSAENYSKGLHFYQIWSDQKLISTGKLLMF